MIASSQFAAALVRAWRHAWAVEAEQAEAEFVAALRREIPGGLPGPLEMSALEAFRAAPRSPGGILPPLSARSVVCARCSEKRGDRAIAAPREDRGLARLRDDRWLAARLGAGVSPRALAAQLGCSVGSVRIWMDRHDLNEARANRKRRRETIVRMHEEGAGPGQIAEILDQPVQKIKRSLKDYGLAATEADQVYMRAEWWKRRLVDQGMPLAEASRQAGLRPGRAREVLRAVELIEWAESPWVASGGRFPDLENPARLRELIEIHGSCRAVAAALGCDETHVARRVKKLLPGVQLSPGRHRKTLQWWAPGTDEHAAWTSLLEGGAEIGDLMAASGLAEGPIVERLRVLRLEGRLWTNVARAERRRRSGA
jgi:hypothetical protein